jgi:transcriptional regulator with GAF, ATPase, and Fis domain
MAADETAHAAANPDQSRFRAATLHWREASANKSFVVSKRAILGSSPDADVRVGDPQVSRVHLELSPAPDGLWIRDLGSKNGTFLNEIRITEARTPARATLKVGSTEIAIRYESGDKRAIELWPEPRFQRMVGPSVAMRALFAVLDRVAKSDAAVLVTGETGTGKELVAEAIHAASSRADEPFVTVDCAALPETLLESELFGHAKGAFTGASAARAGAFESAHGGTVFLDEIGELPLSMQPKLLRVLEAKTVRRVGESAHRPIDVRVIAATHRDLLSMVARAEFREDLYFRLGIVPITVPPLRDRREDIPALCATFAPDLSSEIVSALSLRSYRGNVRELRNMVQRVRTLGLSALDDEPRGSLPPPPPRADLEPPMGDDYRAFREAWIEEGERRFAKQLLERHGGNVSAAARAAGITRNYLHRIMRRHQI